jgi:N-acetyltransferase 10
MRKQLDPRIATLIRNNVALNHRSFFVMVGDHGRDQVVNLHFLLAQSRTTARPNVLWCYKKDLGFTSHRKKREAKIKRDIKRGVRDKGDAMDPFELFVSVTDIRYCYYKDTPKILGRTFGMLVLQDFEAITPNLLARTIETVEGGGVVVLLLKTMTSLRQLYSVAMDVHAKYRSSFDQSDPIARFNERFLLSLSASPNCLVLDDELNVLPISKGRDIRPFDEQGPGESSRAELARQSSKLEELERLREELGQTRVVADVVKHAKTLDQARAVLTILDILASSNLSTTVSLTAGRGRGKSAALGLCIAAAVAHGYSNIFVTSPSPENLRTLFEFLFKGLEALGYEEVADWDLQRGTGEWKDVILRVNIFRGHRQTIQYISPSDAHVLGQAELVVIDEAAAIPLTIVRKLIGPYLVFLSSTINGYEGTGRSLSLKLLQQLRDINGNARDALDDGTLKKAEDLNDLRGGKSGSGVGGIRSLKEVTLNEPIRYSAVDRIESSLHELLCLDATLTPLSAKGSSPHPSTCQLFMVNRDALFSYHPASEAFLQRMMALYVSSHYKNSPNDLQLMSDAPGHRLFVLLAPIQGSSLPEPLCVVQVALEGNINRQSVLNSLHRGQREAGDLIPWAMSQQFQDADFATLSGARVVRIAVHPHHAREGYGARALECLRGFYAGELYDADAAAASQDAQTQHEETLQSFRQDAEGEVRLRDVKRMPALLQRLPEQKAEDLDWIGVSYGITPSLFKFWKQAGYVPMYVRQSANELTGEYNVVQLRSIERSDDSSVPSWLSAFAQDFQRRFLSLLGFKFRSFTAVSALSILQALASASKSTAFEQEKTSGTGQGALGLDELRLLLSPWDMKRLEAYGNNLIDFTVVLDLLPTLASLYFGHRLRVPQDTSLADDADVSESELDILSLSGLQGVILLGLGLQRKDLNDIASELGIAPVQALSLFSKAIRRVVACLRRVEKREIARGLDSDPSMRSQQHWKPLTQSLNDELAQEGRRIVHDEQEKQQQQQATANDVQRAMLDSMDMSKYAIANDEERDWTQAELQAQALGEQDGRSTVVSVKGPARVEEKRKVHDANGSSKPSSTKGSGGKKRQKVR